MKTVIRIVGLGERRKGISSKSNRPYDLQDVAFTYDRRYFTGEGAATCTVNGDVLDGVNLRIGNVYDAIITESFNPYYSVKVDYIFPEV